MKHVLFIAYLFPPSAGGGVQRTVKFLKYLSRMNIRATVITGAVKGGSTQSSLTKDIPTTTNVQRVSGFLVPTLAPSIIKRNIIKWILTVDAEIGWLPFAVKRGFKLIRENKFSTMYSTSAPYTDHLVALGLKEHSDLPWVADFRDPWVANFSQQFATRFHKRFCAYLEDRVVRTADRVLVVSEPMKRQFVERYPGVESDKFVTIPNGFDPDDFKGQTPIKNKNICFRLVYTGNLYGEKQTARPFLQALRKALDRRLIDREKFSLTFFGSVGEKTRRLVNNYGLQDVCKIEGRKSHTEVIRMQLGAEALLLIIGSGPGSDVVFTGKIFEYLAAKKMILALVPDGAASELVKKAKAGIVVDPDDIGAIEKTLVDCYRKWEHGQLRIEPDEQVIDSYARPLQAQRLAEIFATLKCKNI